MQILMSESAHRELIRAISLQAAAANSIGLFEYEYGIVIFNMCLCVIRSFGAR